MIKKLRQWIGSWFRANPKTIRETFYAIADRRPEWRHRQLVAEVARLCACSQDEVSAAMAGEPGAQPDGKSQVRR